MPGVKVNDTRLHWGQQVVQAGGLLRVVYVMTELEQGMHMNDPVLAKHAPAVPAFACTGPAAVWCPVA